MMRSSQFLQRAPRGRSVILLLALASLSVCGCPQEVPGPEQVDESGDPLPVHGLSRFGTLRFKNRESTIDVALSPDGKLVASGSHDGEWSVWELPSGWKVLSGRLEDPEGKRRGVSVRGFSNDGKLLLRAAGILQVWDPAHGEHLCTITAGVAEGAQARLSPDGSTVLTCARDASHLGRILVWDAATGAPSVPIDTGIELQLLTLDPSPDGERIAIAAEDGLESRRGKIYVWNRRQHRVELEFADHPPGLLRGGLRPARIVRFLPGNRIFTSRRVERGQYSSGLAVGGHYVFDAKDGHFLFDLVRDKVNGISTVSCSSDGARLVCGNSLDFGVWNLRTGAFEFDGPELKGLCDQVALAPDGTTLVVAGYQGKRLRMFDLRTQQEIWKPAGHGLPVKGVAFTSDDSLVVSGGGDGILRLSDPDTGRELATHVIAYDMPVLGFVPSNDATALATLHSGGVLLWQQADWSSSGSYPQWQSPNFGPLPASACAIARGGRLIAMAVAGHLSGRQYINQVVVCDVASREITSQWDVPGLDVCHGMAFLAGDAELATAHGGTVSVWNIASGKQVRSLELPGAPGPTAQRTFQLAPDGRSVAASLDETIYLLDGRCSQVLRSWSAPSGGRVAALAWSPDASRLASGSTDHLVRLWDPAAGRLLVTLNGHTDQVTAVAFSHDGTRLVSGADDACVVVWDIGPFR